MPALKIKQPRTLALAVDDGSPKLSASPPILAARIPSQFLCFFADVQQFIQRFQRRFLCHKSLCRACGGNNLIDAYSANVKT
ncbi:hypothetical protein V8J88_23650 [Massilia sp. W12]|uniref:hypothetical protein n=1 Tax=Massilia sp. W12 TaxID=3126507 RepID=UPI0030CD9016